MRLADIPWDVADRLSRGVEETRTLTESCVVDFPRLMECAFPGLGEVFSVTLRPDARITARMEAAGRFLIEQKGVQAIGQVASHKADTVRGWAAYMIRHAPDLSLAQRLERARLLADDPHFGVREWAWIALRPHVAADIEDSLDILSAWTSEESANLRRFAVEIVRPRGVWCRHIRALCDDPEKGRRLLDPLREETARYVQLSVSNWLNDAGKSRPAWVKAWCRRWREETRHPDATGWIVTHALRNL